MEWRELGKVCCNTENPYSTPSNYCYMEIQAQVMQTSGYFLKGTDE